MAKFEKLVSGELRMAMVSTDGSVAVPTLDSTSACILSGSFAPLHPGHLKIAEIGAQRTGTTVWLELSLTNADKQPLTNSEYAKRIAQDFGPNHLVVTNTASFEEKSELFPGCTFLVGSDTLTRISEVRFYNHDEARRTRAIQRIIENGCRFLVFGRMVQNNWLGKQKINIVQDLFGICEFVSRQEFEMNISSTQLRSTRNKDDSE